jgi:hypothetical protein
MLPILNKQVHLNTACKYHQPQVKRLDNTQPTRHSILELEGEVMLQYDGVPTVALLLLAWCTSALVDEALVDVGNHTTTCNGSL